jgi:tRNA dimethylallyltransferase
VKKPIIVITGPTASGKTALSLQVAKDLRGEIICADSMTVYRGMDIGTDKPTVLTKNVKEKSNDGCYEINGICHHLLDIVDPDEEFNVAKFQKIVTRIVEEIHSRGNIPLLVGGSTMYIDAFVYGYEMPEAKPDQALRESLEKRNCEELFEELIGLDPDAEWTIDRHNKRRIIRALEVTLQTGIPFTHQKKKHDLPDNVLYLAVSRRREELYADINRRVDEMMEAGFLEEVENLFKKYDHNTAMQAAGYKQLIQYLDGERTLEEAVERTKQVHRNYAKRQMTWLNKNKDVIWVSGKSEAEKIIKDFLKN